MEQWSGTSIFVWRCRSFFMENQLREQANLIENYIKANGITLQAVELLYNVAETAIKQHRLTKFGLEISAKAKGYIETLIENTVGVGVWALDAYLKQNGMGEVPELQLYFKILLLEAQNMILDSYFLYLEKNRDPEDRFYLPRRRLLLKHGYIQALQELLDDELDILSISSVPGSGKCQPLYSKVLTPNGFVSMGDIRVGDTVISGTGKESKVLGVFPQGLKKVYEITLDDGSKCRCSDDHIWNVQNRMDRRKGIYRNIELKEMLNDIYVEHGKRKNYSIDYIPKIEMKKKKLLLHPYVMGVLLGDGCLSNFCITSKDEEVIDLVSHFLPNGYTLKHKEKYDYRIIGHYNYRGSLLGSYVRDSIRKYGLEKCSSKEKFIPRDYLETSYEDRLWILKGLLDTDGSASDNQIEYCSVSKKLANDVCELVHSLGGYASISSKETSYKKNGNKINCNMAYRVIIQFNSEMESVFGLTRKKNSYNPKRKKIKRFISNVEYVGEEMCQCIYIDDESHLYITDDYIITHNTTLGEMFLSGFMGWFPELCNLFSSHSGHVTRMVYEVMCEIIGVGLKDTKIPEYTWKEVFPNVEIESCNAKEQEINLGKFKPFKTFTARALGASQTGVTRCEGLLYCDDLCSGIEMALSKIRLDKLWTMYSTDLKTRKKKGKGGRTCKELHIATRWSVWDVIGRLINIYANNKRCKFLSIPDIDPETGESNFDYDYGVGFDVAYFEDIQKSLDEITYKCLYKNQPVEREGILYSPDALRRYGQLPPKEPDAIWAFCDTKDTGTDYNCLGVFVQYGTDFYMSDVVFRNIDPIMLDDLNADCLVRNNVQIAQFESNKEGSRTADKVQEKVKEKGGRTSVEKKFTTTNKETKIIVNSPWVIENVLFPYAESPEYPDGYTPNSEMGQFMSHLCSYSQLSKNPNDDAPDMISMLAVRMSEGARRRQAVIMEGFL